MERAASHPEAAIETLRAMLAGSTEFQSFSINVHRKRGISLRVQSADLCERHTINSLGVGLRLYAGKKSAFASTTHMDGEGLRTLVSTCQKKLESANVDYLGEPSALKVPTSGASYERVDPHFLQIHIEEKINRLLNLEASLFKIDPKIKRVERVIYRDLHSEDWIWTSGSDKILYHNSTSGYVSAVAVAVLNGHETKGFGMSSESQYFDLDWSGVVKEATSQALKTLGGTPIASGKYPVLIQTSAMALIWAKFAPVFFADHVISGDSFLGIPHMGAHIFSKALQLSDDPFLRKSIHTRMWDAEGTPTQRVIVAEEGKLNSFCHSRWTAQNFNTQPTGSLVRDDFSDTPKIGFHHLVVEPGRKDFVDLLRDLQSGLVIYQVHDFDQLNLKTGDFNIRVSGTWVEKGEEIKPVDQIALAGNFLDALANIQAIGRDQNTHLYISTPSILFGKLTISGA